MLIGRPIVAGDFLSGAEAAGRLAPRSGGAREPRPGADRGQLEKISALHAAEDSRGRAPPIQGRTWPASQFFSRG